MRRFAVLSGAYALSAVTLSMTIIFVMLLCCAYLVLFPVDFVFQMIKKAAAVMTTQVSINGAVVTISGSQDGISITEETFVGPEGLTVSSEAEFLNFAKAIQVEAKAAWPDLTIIVSTKALQ